VAEQDKVPTPIGAMHGSSRRLSLETAIVTRLETLKSRFAKVNNKDGRPFARRTMGLTGVLDEPPHFETAKVPGHAGFIHGHGDLHSK
jgi:hypothetical protein